MKACRILAGIVSLMAVFLAARGSVHAADNTIAVLGIEATDGAPDSVAALVTDALRQRATGEKGMRLVPGRDLVDIKLIFSCPDEAPTCMADAARNLGAARMIFGSVKRAPGDSYVMTLKMLDVARRQVVAWVAEPLTRAQASPGAVRGPVDKWFATLTGQTATGTVRVRGDVPGTQVALDGAPVGVLGSRELVLTNVQAGRREILASKPGYAPVRKEFTVQAGGVVDVSLELAAGATVDNRSGSRTYGGPSDGPTYGGTSGLVGGLGDEPSKSDSREGLKWGAWTTAAASLASFGLAIKFGLDVQYYNDLIDPLRRFPCNANDKTFGCDRNGRPAEPLRPEVHQYRQDLSEEGKAFQTYEFIALGVGGAFAIASGVLFYFAYFAEDGSVQLGPKADAPRLKMAPFVSAETKGVTARITF
jgi:PEGA domain